MNGCEEWEGSARRAKVKGGVRRVGIGNLMDAIKRGCHKTTASLKAWHEKDFFRISVQNRNWTE
jgi:hypothetical protein